MMILNVKRLCRDQAKKTTTRDDKEHKVQDMVDHLEEQHSSKFTSMQLRILQLGFQLNL